MKYIHYLQTSAQQINAEIEKAEKSGYPVYIFGAHIFTQILLAFGVNEKRLQAVLDNDPDKQGKRLCGTKLDVASPALLGGCVRPHVIVRAGAYADEIRHGLSRQNPEVVFI